MRKVRFGSVAAANEVRTAARRVKNVIPSPSQGPLRSVDLHGAFFGACVNYDDRWRHVTDLGHS